MVSNAEILDIVCSEVLRKLSLACEADREEDREIVCEEVFCDVTGLLDEAAQVRRLSQTVLSQTRLFEAAQNSSLQLFAEM